MNPDSTPKAAAPARSHYATKVIDALNTVIAVDSGCLGHGLTVEELQLIYRIRGRLFDYAHAREPQAPSGGVT